jgi:hypothetical protein
MTGLWRRQAPGGRLRVRGQDGVHLSFAGTGSDDLLSAWHADRGPARRRHDRADIEARDTPWDSTALNWAQVGSGLPHVDNPAPDWVATIQALIEAGASTADITLSPDDPSRPAPRSRNSSAATASAQASRAVTADPETRPEMTPAGRRPAPAATGNCRRSHAASPGRLPADSRPVTCD